jgi:TonB-dependent SusC/RagA subfamily outer membrane receptor
MKYNYLTRGILLFIFFQFFLLSSAQNKFTNGNFRNIYDLLKEVPGLEVTTNGSKTGSIIVRGISSLKRQQQPLFVIDNSIYSGDIMNVNVQDVENISVLKDGASLTAYGAQGSAGVIIISTKKGTTISNGPVVENYSESAYAYFIDHKTKLNIIGLDDKTIIEGVIKKQVDSGLVFINKRKEVIVPIKLIKRVEMLPSDD